MTENQAQRASFRKQLAKVKFSDNKDKK